MNSPKAGMGLTYRIMVRVFASSMKFCLHYVALTWWWSRLRKSIGNSIYSRVLLTSRSKCSIESFKRMSALQKWHISHPSAAGLVHLDS